MAKRIAKNWVWQFRASPEKLWPILADTERLNEALGLPLYRLRETIGEDGLRRRYGEYDVDDERIRWEEPFFEWAKPNWWRWERIYETGPIEFARGTLQMEAGSGGTRVTYTLESEPRGTMGRLLIGTGHLSAAAKEFEKIARLADTYCQNPAGDFFANLFAQRSKRARHKASEIDALLATASEAEREQLAAMVDWAGVAPREDVAVLRPGRMGRALGLAPHEALALCASAVEAGLLVPAFRLICPGCGATVREAARVDNLPVRQGCPVCAADVTRHLAETVEAAFSTAARLRPVELASYCAGSPAGAASVILQQTLDAYERREMPIQLDAKSYRVRVIDGATTPVFILPQPGGIQVRAGADWIDDPAAADSVVLENHAEHPLTIRLETDGWPDGVSPAADLLLHHRWYDRVAGEAGGLSGEEPLGDGALLAVGAASANLPEVARGVAEHAGGAVTETMRDGAILAFRSAAQARQAAVSIVKLLPNSKIGADYGALVLDQTTGRATIQGAVREFALRLRDRCEPSMMEASNAFNAAAG